MKSLIFLLILFSAMILTYYFDKLMLFKQTIVSTPQPQPDYGLPSTASEEGKNKHQPWVGMCLVCKPISALLFIYLCILAVVSTTIKLRQQEAQCLTSAVQTAITRLQNPADCTQAKKLVCHMTWGGCGFGCLIHHTTYCLITALATGRVLVLSDRKWPHSDLVIKTFLRPLSTSCFNYTGICVLCVHFQIQIKIIYLQY